jgi:opacity protein-like surface antigen
MKPFHHIFIALCLLLYSSPAHARHSGPYARLHLGGNILADAKAEDSQGSFNLAFDPGLQGGIAFGWDLEENSPLGEGRIELEYTRSSSPLDRAEFVEGRVNGSGDMTADSLLLNFIGVLHGNSRWSPHAGIGIGAARIEASNLKVSGQPLSNDTATVFAYQLGVGVDYALTGVLALDVGYRFFGSSKPEFTETGGRKFETGYYNHSLVLGLRLGF